MNQPGEILEPKTVLDEGAVVLHIENAVAIIVCVTDIAETIAIRVHLVGIDKNRTVVAKVTQVVSGDSCHADHPAALRSELTAAARTR